MEFFLEQSAEMAVLILVVRRLESSFKRVSSVRVKNYKGRFRATFKPGSGHGS
ncbi:hypothetical protein Hanom_Chr12g01140241 [Helianthus anomalus]